MARTAAVITLYTFGPKFGLPDPSPFVIKTEILLKMAGLPFRVDTGGFRKAPKGKLPYIRDGDDVIADSTFIRFHIETKYGFDFDSGLNIEQKAAAWALEKMAENELYWAAVNERWMIEDNFNRGPRAFFDGVPAPIRPLVIHFIRGQVRRNLYGHGIGRHKRHEIIELGRRDIQAIADFLGDKTYVMGDEPHGVDATIGSFAMGILCEQFESPLLDYARCLRNVVDYEKRIRTRYFAALQR
ncbi:MAG: glutathione S-transferase family protein [Pseudomonadota bacterium]|nr:glutathione S-transferase family protein [Pseudomonadota bacterium]